MWGKIRFLSIMFVVVGSAVFWTSCGGKNPTKLDVKSDGRIFVENKTTGLIKTSYFNPDMNEQIDDEVQPNEKKDVSHFVIKAGTKITVTLIAMVGWVVDEDAEVTIDGNVTIRVTYAAPLPVHAIWYEVLRGD